MYTISVFHRKSKLKTSNASLSFEDLISPGSGIMTVVHLFLTLCIHLAAPRNIHRTRKVCVRSSYRVATLPHGGTEPRRDAPMPPSPTCQEKHYRNRLQSIRLRLLRRFQWQRKGQLWIVNNIIARPARKDNFFTRCPLSVSNRNRNANRKGRNMVTHKTFLSRFSLHRYQYFFFFTVSD